MNRCFFMAIALLVVAVSRLTQRRRVGHTVSPPCYAMLQLNHAGALTKKPPEGGSNPVAEAFISSTRRGSRAAAGHLPAWPEALLPPPARRCASGSVA